MAIRAHFGPADGPAQARLGSLLASHLAAADLLGRLQILRHARSKTGSAFPMATGARALYFSEHDVTNDAIAAMASAPAKDATAGFGFDVGGDRTAAFIRGLTPVTKEVFDGLSAHYRRDAFTLAGTADVRLIGKVQESLAEAAAKGATAATFRKAANALTTEQGVAALNRFTLDTAFNIGMQKAYSAGRLEQMQEAHMMEALPFWQYWTMEDDRVRPEHAAIDQFVAQAIDPVWKKIYPPSGYNCRCGVVPLPRDEALAIDPDAEHGGLERLPQITEMLVPTPGFNSPMGA